MLDYPKKVLQESRSEHATRVPFFRGKKQTFCSFFLGEKKTKDTKDFGKFYETFLLLPKVESVCIL
jgi:hypothetical protein